MFQNSTGQLDPNINSAFDYADFLVNADGRLTNDRTHQFKFDGSYEFQTGLTGLNLGFSTYWFSGMPLNAYGYSFAYANWEYYLAPRGSLGRGPSEWEANLQAQYPIRFGDNKRLNLMMDIFNLFDRQKPIQLDERYNLQLHGRCLGGSRGPVQRRQWLADPARHAVAARLVEQSARERAEPGLPAKGVLFTQPRSIRFGVRFQW